MEKENVPPEVRAAYEAMAKVTAWHIVNELGGIHWNSDIVSRVVWAYPNDEELHVIALREFNRIAQERGGRTIRISQVSDEYKD